MGIKHDQFGLSPTFRYLPSIQKFMDDSNPHDRTFYNPSTMVYEKWIVDRRMYRPIPEPGAPTVARTIWIGNLPPEVNEHMVGQTLANNFGAVEDMVIRRPKPSPETQQQMLYGFCTFFNTGSRDYALEQAASRIEFYGYYVRVNTTRNPISQRPGYSGYTFFPPVQPAPTARVPAAGQQPAAAQPQTQPAATTQQTQPVPNAGANSVTNVPAPQGTGATDANQHHEVHEIRAKLGKQTANCRRKRLRIIC